MHVDFFHLEQAYLMARDLSKDPQMPNANRFCCHVIAVLIRDACADVAQTWGRSDAAPAFARSTE
jgi:hypothetical protein